MKRNKLYSTDSPPDEDPHARADGRRKRRKEENALLELARQIALLDERDVDRLDLPEEIRDAVDTARSCRSGTPRARALRRVRATLRCLDPESIAQTQQRATEFSERDE